MIELPISITNVEPSALHQALSPALGSKLLGVKANWNPLIGVAVNPVLAVTDLLTAGEQTSVNSIIAAHDPVLLTVDKTTIQKGGSDVATIVVVAPKAGAAAVQLEYSVNGGSWVNWSALTFVNTVASDTLSSLDSATIQVRVNNGSNRSAIVLTIQAV